MSENKHILYAPIRKKYINSDTKKKSKNPKTCIFCNPSKKEIIVESKTCFVQANKYPYSTGHVLVIPKRHVNTIIDLTSKEKQELFNLIDMMVYALKLYIKPDGYNIGCSVGKVAGESISHLHFHVLPRFEGDVGWARIFDFEILSTLPEEFAASLKEVVIKNKLKKKFDVS